MTKKRPLALGTRIKHKSTGKGALVVGPAQHGMCFDLIPVALENSTRQETWPEHLCVRRVKRDQLPAMGGNYQPPKGYPFNTK